MRISFANVADSLHSMKIVRIQNINSTLTCVNDDDNDGTLNAVDSLPRKYGDVTANGAPDDDLDGVPDAYDRCRGTYGTRENKGCPESYFITNKQLEGAIG